MISRVYWVNDPHIGEKVLGMMARPRGDDWLEDEIKSLSYRGIKCLVSLLERSEARELGLAEEAELCQKYGIEFISFPIENISIPDDDKAFLRLLENLSGQLREQNKVLVHCRAGIGRSSILTSCLMIGFGTRPEEVFERLTRFRELEVPDTEEQKKWVMLFSDKMNLSGKLKQ